MDNTTEETLALMWIAVTRLAQLLTWLALAVLHLALLTALLLVLWTMQLSPSDFGTAFQGMRQSTTASVLAAAGLTVGGALAGYWWLVKWVHRATARPLADYLLQSASHTR